MKDWIMELCPEIAEWQADLIAETVQADRARLERATELLHRAETEMRYAGWTRYEADNSARNGVYEQIVRFLK